MTFDDNFDESLDGPTEPLKPTDFLVIVEQGQPIRTVALDRPMLTIGRATENDVVLSDPQVSRRHARVARLNVGIYTIEDLESRNGTHLEGERLSATTPQPWKPGVEIRIGPYFLRLEKITDDLPRLADKTDLLEDTAKPKPGGIRDEGGGGGAGGVGQSGTDWSSQVREADEVFEAEKEKQAKQEEILPTRPVPKPPQPEPITGGLTPQTAPPPRQSEPEPQATSTSTLEILRSPAEEAPAEPVMDGIPEWLYAPESDKEVGSMGGDEQPFPSDDFEVERSDVFGFLDEPGAKLDQEEQEEAEAASIEEKPVSAARPIPPPMAAAPIAPPQPAPAYQPAPAPPAPEQQSFAPRGGLAPAPVPSDTANETQFAAYYPREIEPKKWQQMTAYVYKASLADEIARDAEKQHGSLVAAMRRIVQTARSVIPQGTLITATPYLPGFVFNPPQITVGFYEDWHRFDFKLSATNTPMHQAVNGALTFSVEGVIVADVPLAIYVGDAVSAAPKILTTQKLYESIFCSYSHTDTVIVERVERVYRALGFDFLRDVHSLKSGQHWNNQIYSLIDKADIFQLFWSDTASKSEFVTREWKHALSLDRDQQNFIRPVYWQQPMPIVPSELSRIHFAYEPTLDD